MKPLIYALYDPRDNKAKYIGYTKNLANRMCYHYRDRKYSATGRLQCTAQPWLYELAEIGLMPISRPLEWLISGSNWEEREQFWIAAFREAGEPLLNGTDGGYGSRGCVPWRRMSEASRENVRKRARETAKAQWESALPEEKSRVLLLLAEGRSYRHPELDGPHTEEHCKRISSGLKKAYKDGRRKPPGEVAQGG